MKTIFEDKAITGILTILPETETSFEDTINSDSITRVNRLKRIMGFDKRRRVKRDTNVSDLYRFGAMYLLEHNFIGKEEIGAIVTVTLSPDFYLPSASSMIHSYMDLNEDVMCVDIPQGCAGYIVGLMEAFMLLNHMKDKKVLLFTGDILNRMQDREPLTDEPCFGGDAVSVSVVENCIGGGSIYMNFYSDGVGGKRLIMPAGAYAHPVFNPEDAYVRLEDGREGYGLGVWMDGSDVFNFIIREVPPMIEEILQFSGKGKEDIYAYLFHQPNRYILEKLADHLKIPRNKMPMDIVEKYGNSNSSTIPMVICENLSEEMKKEKKCYCLSGFGSGLSWASVVMELGLFDFCERIVSDL